LIDAVIDASFFKLRDERLVRAVFLAQHLQRNGSIQLRVERAIDLAHAAGAEFLLELEMIEVPPHPLRRPAGWAMNRRERLLV
jgi:hypothetical protein